MENTRERIREGERESEREREREREKGAERERETDRQAETDRQRQRDRVGEWCLRQMCKCIHSRSSIANIIHSATDVM